MQTFLPYSDFNKVAKCLDSTRLYKQIVECKQILQTLDKIEYKRTHYKNGDEYKKLPWENHPAVLMWKGYELTLRDYQEAMLQEWIIRRWNTYGMPNSFLISSDSEKFGKDPEWLGDERLHSSHRAMLHWKDPEYYRSFKFDYIELCEEHNIDISVFDKPTYWWPITKDNKDGEWK